MARNAIPTLVLTRKASGTINPYRFVTPAGAQAGADANALGTCDIGAVSGDVIPVNADGTAIIQTGAAVADGATLKSDANGKAITWATSGAKLAIALEAASGADQYIEVRLIQNVA